MLSSFLYDQVGKLEKDLADNHKKLADETKKELDKQKQIDSIERSITSSTSVSTLNSKRNQIRGYQNDLLNIQKKKADLYKRQFEITTNLNKKRQEVLKEEQREREKTNREQEDFQRRMELKISEQKRALSDITRTEIFQSVENTSEQKQYDFFISHASEDKEDFVRSFAQKLREKGKEVWVDELILKVGDSLRRKIDNGLKNSKFGIVVLSTYFFKKNWTQHELDGLVAREMNGVKVILPIWHKVSKDEVFSYSPTLADKVALNTSILSLDEIVEELLKVLE